ncbi:hypothetical protein G7Y89_g13575 [Cudoniella acicularis]|uniref:Isochorismatase-like domain-containing protein n=1 Tax=Cudoniella acicularis TaxID=354080 RepID=A0A8H4VVX2_9HELO|nr:hypothetical protein G7Y89_g13575 [Cudoniella acicularis]
MSDLSPSDYPEYTAHMGGNLTKSTKLLGFGSRPALMVIGVFVNAARGAKAPILWIQTRFQHPNMKDSRLLTKKMSGLDVLFASDESGLGDLLPGFEPDMQAGDTTLYKKFHTASFGTNLSTQLHALNVDTLVICRACTGGSVRAMTLDAMQSGFRAMVVAKGCADMSRQVHFSNLFDLNAKYGDVVSMEAVENLKVEW